MPNRMKLTDVDLLAVLESHQAAGHLTDFKIRHFNRKQIISRPAQEDNFIFLVKSGRIRIFLTYEDKEFTLAILEKGDIYSSHTRAYTQALEDTVLMVTDIRNFNGIITAIPAFALTMVKVLGDLLKNSFSIIDSLVFKEAHTRLAEFLIEAAEKKGKRADKVIIIELGLTTEDIAMLLGLTRQTVSTLLSDLQRMGMIEKKGRKAIVINDLEGIKKLTLD